MPTLSRKFNWGSEAQNSNPELYNQLSDVYENTASVVNTKISKYIATTDALSTAQVNKNFDIGDVWVNKLTNRVWMMTSRTTDVTVTWTPLT